MFNKYFQEELSGLREIAGEFSKENPAIAPMLGDTASDPDVERLLESVAFLTGSIRERIEDEFPEIIHDFLRQIWPHYLRPLPSSTIMEFSHSDLAASGTVPKDIYIDSKPVDGVKCRFKTCSDVIVHPLSITGADYREPAGKRPFIRLSLTMTETSADHWHSDSLEFYLAGGIKNAADLYYALLTRTQRIIIRNAENDVACILQASNIQPSGFSDQNVLIPYPSNSFKGYRLIQEYLHMPEKFMFLTLTGLNAWKNRGSAKSFSIDFEFNAPPEETISVHKTRFVLSATPAVNVFSHPATPVVIDHRKTEYPIRPAGNEPANYQVYEIEKVYGFVRGIAKEQEFESFHSFRASESGHIYNEKIRRSPVYDKIDFTVNLAYPPGYDTTSIKTLAFDILCTNGNLPEQIEPQGISERTATTPEFVTFKNLIKPTVAVMPQIGTNMLWRLVSLLTINASTLAKPENLKALLRLYLMKEGNRDMKRVMANEKRIEGIRSLETENTERLINGSMMRGVVIRMQISRKHFAGSGDLYLFGMVIDHFFGLYASINTFTKLIIDETDTGETYTWPERIGNKQII